MEKLNLIFAPSADMLVPLAEESIRRAWEDPFVPPAVIVPNPAVGKWLKVKLAESPSFGCVANARMTTLEKFLWRALGGGDGADMITARHLSQVICAILDDEVLNDGVYARLKNYLYRPDGRIDALKRVQLSMRIASQFLEYEYNRPGVWDNKGNTWRSLGIDAKWIGGKPYYGGDGHEAWQMDLYRRVNKCLAGGRLISLPHLYGKRREERAKEKGAWCDVGVNRRIILFGVSKISHFHRNTLVEISQIDGVEMHVFLTNPCAEFWEDVNTSRQSVRRKWLHDSPDGMAGIKPVRPEHYNKSELSEIDMFANKRDHRLLELWGGAGKENIFLWCPQADWNFEYVCDDAEPADTLLGLIQRSLLLRKNDLDTPREKLKNDRSLQILACPDIGREVEELREMILDMAHEESIGNFNDVAVYMPDTNKYLPHIQRVFGAFPRNHPEYIPFAILGASGGSSLISRALFALMDIVSGQFNRARIFELLRNPIVWATKEISPDDVETWAEWAEKFGMFRGYDGDQRKNMGDMGEAITDEHTFKFGMEKVMEAIGSEDDGRESAETFLSLLKELNELSSMNNVDEDGMVDISESVKTLQNAVWSWLGNIPNDDSVDCAAESRVRREALDGFDLILLQRDPANRKQMPANEFMALARGCVPEETAVPASAWNGVTFAPLRASMTLPHRAIFALGLGASDFPGVSESVSWNLLADRIIGDSDRVRDNRFAFLELIHAAKERLTLSYRARDIQKDEELQSSSVIMELEEYLVGQGLTDGKEGSRRSCVWREIPLVVYESLDRAVEAGRGHGTWDRTQRELAVLTSMPLKDRVRHRHELARRSKSGGGADQGDVPVNNVGIGDLKRFFRNPLVYHLYRTLGIRNDEDVETSETDEPVMSDKWSLRGLREKVWIAVLKAVFPPDTSGALPVLDDGGLAKLAVSEAAKVYGEHVGSGQAPEGYVGRSEKNALCGWAARCVKPALRLSKNFSSHEFAENLEFSLECGGFTLSGCHAQALIPKVPEDVSAGIGLLSFGDTKTDPLNLDRSWLYAAAQWLCENSNGGARAVTSFLLSCGDSPGEKISTVTRDIVKLAAMKEWLAGMLSQMLVLKRCEHLPFSVVSGLVKPSKDIGFEKCLQELTFAALEEKIPACSGKYAGGGINLTDAKPMKMSDDELRGVVASRYAPMLGRWIHG